MLISMRFLRFNPSAVGHMRHYRHYIVAFAAALILALAPGIARAACSSPTGSEGQLMYNNDYHTPQYCDGTVWRRIGLGLPGAADTTSNVALHYRFNETTGATSAADYSGNANTGTRMTTDALPAATQARAALSA